MPGCGGDDDSSDAAASTTGAPAPSPGTGESIKVGFVNSEGGALSVPEFRPGAFAAQDNVNEHLGGVNGRPLEYIRCDADGSPEKSIDCANTLIEQGVVAVQIGSDVGVDATVPIYADAGIPLIGNSSQGPLAQAAENAFWMGVASPAYYVAPLTYDADQGAERIRFFMLDFPSAHAIHDSVVVPLAEELGLDYDTIFYAPGSDWSVLATSGLAEQADVLGIPAAAEGDCTGAVSAFRATGFTGEICGGVCSEFISELGANAVGVNTVAGSWRISDRESIPADKQEEADVYTEAMLAAGHDDLATRDSFAIGSFTVTMNLVRILTSIERTIDGASVSTAMRATKDFDSFLGPSITCDHTAWPGTASCSSLMLYYEVGDDEALHLASDGFVDLARYAD